MKLCVGEAISISSSGLFDRGISASPTTHSAIGTRLHTSTSMRGLRSGIRGVEVLLPHNA